MAENTEQEDFIVVFEPDTEWQGDLFVQELKAANINAYLANRTTNSIWGSSNQLATLEILTSEADAEKAKAIIEELLANAAPVDEVQLDLEAEDSPGGAED